MDIHNTRRTRLKLSNVQRLASPHRPRKLPKTTLATAKHSVLRGCIPRYALALKAASKVSDISLPSATRSRLDRHSHQEDVDFVVSQNLLLQGMGRMPVILGLTNALMLSIRLLAFNNLLLLSLGLN